MLPRVSDIFLSGTLVEGETLEAQFQVAGGYEGQNSLKWFRGTQKEEGVTIWEDISCIIKSLKNTILIDYNHIPVADSPKYTLTLEDVGKPLKFQFLPVNERGIPGDVGEEVTKPIEPGLLHYFNTLVFPNINFAQLHLSMKNWVLQANWKKGSL